MELIAIQACVDGDFVLNMVPVLTDDTMEEVGKKIAHHSVNRRVAPQDKPLGVRFQGVTMPADATVESAGIGAMDVVYAFYEA
ncbi:toluene-4-monooxygenase system B family protein [Nocardioides aquiterrae]|uniref:Toluene monooxygenase n=1 Tax=Nocardioides aquiterrae TaxID=203799 RepID=A0ABN1UQU5_9ACTN